jgi:hypothetical protein
MIGQKRVTCVCPACPRLLSRPGGAAARPWVTWPPVAGDQAKSWNIRAIPLLDPCSITGPEHKERPAHASSSRHATPGSRHRAQVAEPRLMRRYAAAHAAPDGVQPPLSLLDRRNQCPRNQTPPMRAI